MQQQPPWQNIVLDLAVIAALTVLGAMKIAPIEAVLTMLGMFVGARAMQRMNGGGGGPPAAGGGGALLAGGSTAAALFLGLGHIMRGSHA